MLQRVGLFVVVVCGMMIVSGVCAQSPSEKLGRGLANTFLGVFEVPNQMVNTYRKETGRYVTSKNNATVRAISVGTVKGFKEAFRRTGVGIWDTVTFMSPGCDEERYSPRIKPDIITEHYKY